MPTAFRITRDITGEAYLAFVTAALRSQHSFLLVWPDQLDFTKAARAVCTGIANLQIRRQRTDRWPGTQIWDSRATIVTYKCHPTAFSYLARPGSLFSWQAPDYPEDLAFFRHRGVCSLASVSHEQEAWILCPELRHELADIVPVEEEELSENDWQAISGVQ
jgi:hypothetical protein